LTRVTLNQAARETFARAGAGACPALVIVERAEMAGPAELQWLEPVLEGERSAARSALLDQCPRVIKTLPLFIFYRCSSLS
jgi:hypothetical protein